MPMFETEEEFEAYVERQQAELEAQGIISTKPAQAPGLSAQERTLKTLNLIVPVLALCVAIAAFVLTQSENRDKSYDPWDNILGSVAAMTGTEYNANADSLTERLTFRKKK